MGPKSKPSRGQEASSSLVESSLLEDARKAWKQYSDAKRKGNKKLEGSEKAVAQLAASIEYAADQGSKLSAALDGMKLSAEEAYVPQLCFGHMVRDIVKEQYLQLYTLPDGPRPAPEETTQRVIDLLDHAHKYLAKASSGVKGHRSMTAIHMRVELLDAHMRLLSEGLADVAREKCMSNDLLDFTLNELSGGWEDEAAFIHPRMEAPPFDGSISAKSVRPQLAKLFVDTWAFFSHHYKKDPKSRTREQRQMFLTVNPLFTAAKAALDGSAGGKAGKVRGGMPLVVRSRATYLHVGPRVVHAWVQHVA